MVIIRLYYLSIRSRGESMGNLGGTSKKVPHPANPLHIGILGDKWGMGNLLPFSCFMNRVQQKAQQLLLLRLTNRAIASFTSS